MDFAQIFGELSAVFLMILQIFVENADLHNSRAHAVFRTLCDLALSSLQVGGIGRKALPIILIYVCHTSAN